jgi:hypothetical protein
MHNTNLYRHDKLPFYCTNSRCINNIFVFVTILDMSLISRSCKNDHIIFNVGTQSLEARNIRLVNIITYTCIIEESKLQGYSRHHLTRGLSPRTGGKLTSFLFSKKVTSLNQQITDRFHLQQSVRKSCIHFSVVPRMP